MLSLKRSSWSRNLRHTPRHVLAEPVRTRFVRKPPQTRLLRTEPRVALPVVIPFLHAWMDYADRHPAVCLLQPGVPKRKVLVCVPKCVYLVL